MQGVTKTDIDFDNYFILSLLHSTGKVWKGRKTSSGTYVTVNYVDRNIYLAAKNLEAHLARLLHVHSGCCSENSTQRTVKQRNVRQSVLNDKRVAALLIALRRSVTEMSQGLCPDAFKLSALLRQSGH